MKILSRLRAALAFTEGPTTILAVLVYVLILGSVLYTDELTNVPKARKQQGLNITTAYRDLHAIAARPHPFAVRANDDVRSYILSRVKAAASGHSFITVDSDMRSNASWGGTSGQGIYFEGTNVLVKIDGTDPKLSQKTGAVLFSAHYDSVSTAPGATDDGMGVATLLQLVDYLAEHRPKRTAVFNINNGEEDGLHGAHVFMEHPWANICTTFLNLEGAAAGGRPLLFRASSYEPVRAFHVPHPHTNVLSADAYKRGVIRSYTDYAVYIEGNGTEGSGMAGLDLAFYKGRAKYHTKYDSVPHTAGGRKALWAMMESSRAAGLALLNGKDRTGDRERPAVYFDLLGRALIAFPLNWLFGSSIAMLVLGPLIIGALLITTIITARRRSAEAGAPPPGIHAGGTKGLIFALIGWVRFWVALGITVLVGLAAVTAYVHVNPYVIHSHPLAVTATLLAGAYVALVVPLSLAHLRPTHSLPATSSRQQKLATLLETYILAWVLLLGATIAAGRLEIGGGYVVAAWHACLLTGATLALVEAWLRARSRSPSDVGAGLGEEAEGDGPESQRRLVRGVRYEVGGTDTGAADLDDGGREVRAFAGDPDDTREPANGEHREGVIVETEPTEITPLMAQHRRNAPGEWEDGKDDVAPWAREELGWWLAQMLVAVPVPVLLFSQVGLLLLNSLSQTLIDGSSAANVYTNMAVLSFLVILPLAPFAHKLHRLLTIFVAVVFVLGIAYTLSATPFTPAAPMKVYFAESLELPPTQPLLSGPASLVKPRNRVSLTGVSPYVKEKLVPELPSSWGKTVNCSEDNLRGPGLVACAWESDLLPTPGTKDHWHSPGAAALDKKALVKSAPALATKDWLQYSADRTGNTSVRITLAGTNSRACRVYFDSRPVSTFRVHGANPDFRSAFPLPAEGVKQVNLWSRTWARTFVLDAEWKLEAGDTEGVKGRVACEWAEYESGSAGGGGSGGRIPALEEVLAFLPRWALTTKRMEGLVEAWTEFEV